MGIVYGWLFVGMWATWLGYWWVAARHVKPSVKVESAASRRSHFVPLFIGFTLVWWPAFPVSVLRQYVLPGEWQTWAAVGTVLTAAGLSFAIWARAKLGGNWSGQITVKESHELTTSGPYSLVRHPIYTGLLLALLGEALARGRLQGFIGVALACITLWRKLRIEERYMGEVFGVQYAAYRDRVAALIPFVL
ncbi:MAG TPA: isoprenylcysteine carboxylmethyltransferase family protein [Steroidobacteraceae bacterium]|jgi:protein-S-isoprenylcysteine O-methyltransferase Ste14